MIGDIFLILSPFICYLSCFQNLDVGREVLRYLIELLSVSELRKMEIKN